VGRGRTQSSGLVDTVIQIEVPSDKFVVGTVLLVQKWGEETQRRYWSIWIKVARTKWVDECGHPFTHNDMSPFSRQPSSPRKR